VGAGRAGQRGADREKWALFARNWGNEGFCSSEQHPLELPSRRFTVRLPWRDGATRVRLGRGTRFLANVEGVVGWWSPVRGDAVEVTFQLPEPSVQARVHGEIALVWSGAPAAALPVATTRPPRGEEERGVERQVEEAVEQLSPAQREALEARALAATRDTFPVALQHGTPPPAAVSAPATASRPDPARDAEDLRRLRALIELYGGRIPRELELLAALLGKP
jgi:hypothetical protein